MDLGRFLELAAESGVITADVLQQAAGEFVAGARAPATSGSDVPALVDYLVSGDLLTRWQGDMLLAGRSQEFFLGKFKFLDHLGTDGRRESFLVQDMDVDRRVMLSFGVEASDAAATVFEMKVLDPMKGVPRLGKAVAANVLPAARAAKSRARRPIRRLPFATTDLMLGIALIVAGLGVLLATISDSIALDATASRSAALIHTGLIFASGATIGAGLLSPWKLKTVGLILGFLLICPVLILLGVQF